MGQINISDLPLKDKFSYSRLDCFRQCKMRYKLKYLDGNYDSSSTLPLRIGTLIHKALELKYEGKQSLEEIWNGLENGYVDGREKIDGLNTIISEFGFDYYDVDEKTQMSMEMKIANFKETFFIPIDESNEWEAIGLEVPFEFIFDKKLVIRGFIDRVDQHKKTGNIRVVDYKTSKKLYAKADLATSLQFYIYALACEEIYDKTPTEFIYDMVFLKEKQYALTKGWENRGYKKLSSLVNSLIEYQELGSEHMPPTPSALCHWCNFCKTNENAMDKHKNLCEYFMNWTRQKRDFSVNKKWVAPIVENDDDEWDW